MIIKKKPTMLMILDGFGAGKDDKGNAIKTAKTPNIDNLFSKYPHTLLKCSGQAVGLPDGQMGNSEVGHLNIGSGRIIYQELSRITKSIDDGSFFANKELNLAMDHCKKNDSTLHLFGLLSDGGVHSHINHLFALVDLAKKKGIESLNIHCFLDGRDVPPSSALGYIEKLENYLTKVGLGKISTVSGRYYSMDRDKRWDRVKKAYDAMTIGNALEFKSAKAGIQASYDNDLSDEFVIPFRVENTPFVSDGDGVIMYNFRPDRAREITRAFVDSEFDGFTRKKIVKNLCYVTMTQYDVTIPNVNVAYKPESYKNTLGEYLSTLEIKQLRIAETEKYAHVTFFFNGGVEAANKYEDRILINSPKVATYDMQPEMSAYLVKDEVLKQIASDKYDVIILNFANCDMVGHTGDFDAAVKAVEAVDTCVGEISKAILDKDGQMLLTADHGNADVMLAEDGSKMTAHSMNDVPLINISSNAKKLKADGKLCDLAPTLLDMMGLKIPAEMTGKSLLK